jgi:hypothetical protein
MSLSRKSWPPEVSEDYEQVLRKVVESSASTSDRLDHFEDLLNDGIQAGILWALEIERSAPRDLLAKELRNFQNRSRAMVSYDGKVLNLPRVQSARVRSESGRVYHQRELIELWPWEQIVAKRTEALKAMTTYTAKIAHYDKLLALRDACPIAISPSDAAIRLGVSLESWLAGELAA